MARACSSCTRTKRAEASKGFHQKSLAKIDKWHFDVSMTEPGASKGQHRGNGETLKRRQIRGLMDRLRKEQQLPQIRAVRKPPHIDKHWCIEQCQPFFHGARHRTHNHGGETHGRCATDEHVGFPAVNFSHRHRNRPNETKSDDSIAG
jgi:hypothetical protein